MVTLNKALLNPAKGLVDRRIFVDKDIYAQELEQIFGRAWLFIGHESQIPKPNDFVANYMGEDPILLTRDSKGKLHAFLNMCRHRGNRICRADAGNAPSFMCTYHGWTFATDGKLVGVPGYKEAYFEELDRSQWGLVETAHCESYKGLVFATWDKSAPALIDYMGDMAWFLDMVVDRRAGGSELVGGVHRWVLEANWKFGADNFGGDTYHFPTTHGSAINTKIVGKTVVVNIYDPTKRSVHPGNGHGVLSAYVGPGVAPPVGSASGREMAEYYRQHLPELASRLGEPRSRQFIINVATMFPNFTWHPGPIVRMWHPRGPTKTEIWSYCIVDKEAPPDIKKAMRNNLMQTFGPAGSAEQDDMNNWIQCTSTARSMKAAEFAMNVQLGLGHEGKHEELPGQVSMSPSETNQRAFYGRWAEMMQAPSWGQISLTPRTKV